ncbi:MFS transporter [Novosphingobium cyanobacteriorum]|uniref:MFS transporter n=1 Tax=Novosphingobium cyanobacteriorum TaxID=3024215 RepID=A0ABT6CLA2_9SPHN|nr:MFS transporter [Novosphingobium cyanobacteriorum]MDF8334008.1 MFS transporter [Novosphingobium cyanobacteriorum]
MAIVLLAPVVPQMMQAFADVPAHEYWVPMIVTVPSLCVALLCPFAGILADCFGRRTLLLIALAVYAVVGVAPVFLHTLPEILVSRVGVGVAEALIYVVSTTMIGDYYGGAARDRWLAGQTAFASMSALLFFNIGGFLGEGGWRAPFWVYLSALAMFGLVLAYTWEPAPDDAAAQTERAVPSRSWHGFPWAMTALIAAITVYGSVFFYTVQIQASSGLVALGLTSPSRIGFLTSIASIGVPLGTLLYSRIGGAQLARLLVAEFLMLAVGFALMGQTASVNGFLMGCFINQLGAGMLLPTLLVWSMSVLSFEYRGRGTGLW